MNKKSIGALLLSAALLVGATGSTFAYFTGSAESNTQIITMGDVGVKIDNATQWEVKTRAESWDSAWDAFFNGGVIDPVSFLQMAQDSLPPYTKNITNPSQDAIQYLAPGDVVMKSFKVTNTGNLDEKIKLSLTNLAVTGTQTITGSTPNPDKYLFKVYKVDADGKPTNLVTIKEDAQGCGNFVLDPNEKVIVYVTVGIDKLTKNDFQNGTISFKVHVDATQWNNPGWLENGN